MLRERASPTLWQGLLSQSHSLFNFIQNQSLFSILDESIGDVLVRLRFCFISGLFGLLRPIVFWCLGFWVGVKFLFSVFVFSFYFQFLFSVFVCSFCFQLGLMFLVQKNIADIVGPVVVVAEAQGYTRERTSDLITRVGQCWKNHPTKIISIRRCQSHYANTGKSIIYLARNNSTLLVKATF